MSEVLEIFYVISESGYVLSVTETHSVILSTRIGTKKQLWKWNENNLISVYHKNCALAVNSELVVITSVRKVNQKWRYEDNCLIHEKTSLKLSTKKKDKEGVKEGCSIVVSATNDNEEQLWAVEPRLGTVEMDDLLLYEPTRGNPVDVFCYWKSILHYDIKALIGCNISDYKKTIEEAVRQMRQCADTLDTVITKSSIARAVGAGLGAVGSIAGFVGICFAPLTGGTSLLLSTGSAVSTVAGGVTSLAGAFVMRGWEKDQTSKAKIVTNDCCRLTQSLQELLAVCMKKLSEANDYKDLIEERKEKVGKINNKGANVGFNVAIAGPKINRGIKGYKELIANNQAALKVRSVDSRGIYDVIKVAGLGFGIWETINAAVDISNGSKIATDFRTIADNLETVGKEIITNYEKIVFSE